MSQYHSTDPYPTTKKPKKSTAKRSTAQCQQSRRGPQKTGFHHETSPDTAALIEYVKRGKGRPPQWSESWRKRLVVLRMCGLELKEILEIIGIVSDGEFVPDHPNRRAQQIVRELIASDYPQMTPSDSETIERMAGLLNQIKRGQPKEEKEAREPWRDESPVAPKASSLLGMTEGRRRPSGSKKPLDPLEELLEEEQMMAYDMSANYPTPESMIARAAVPTRHALIRGLLKGHGRTSACISEVVSLLSGFSLNTSRLSSLYTTNRKEDSKDEFALSESPALPTPQKVEDILANQERRTEQANSALISACCSVKSDCLHRRLQQTMSAPGRPHFQSDDVEAINWTDAYGNNLLFFAGRIGAPAEIILDILEKIKDVNAVNEDGQTFMSVLDPRGFTKNAAASYKFFILLKILEQRNFDFEHFDYDGRNWLSLMVMRPAFKMEWFSTMFQAKKWQTRLTKLARHRDASGLFLIDYLNEHPNAHALDQKIIAHLLADFDLTNFEVGQIRTLKRDLEFAEGRSLLHQMYVEHHDPLSSKQQGDSSIISFFSLASFWAHHYDIHGETPLMLYLRTHCRGPNPKLIVARDMIKQGGADVNQRNRDGGTVLHFAAKHSLLSALEFFTSCGAKVNHRDHRGFSALDYAVASYNRSRTRSEKAELMARSLKCIRLLLDRGAHAAYLPDVKGRRVTTKRGHEIVIPETDVWNEAVQGSRDSYISYA